MSYKPLSSQLSEPALTLMFVPYGDNVERKIFPIVPIFLILMNVCVYLHTESIIMTDNEEFEATTEFYNTFGLTPENLGDGQVIGLLTHMFMHDGIMHLLGNMIILWAMARSLEALMGRLALVVCYCLWGVFGGLLHAFADWGATMPLVGASGAVAGLIGAYTVAFGPFAKLKCLVFLIPIPFKVQIPAIVFGLLFIFMQLLEASSDPNMLQNISWYTHIGGFIAGAGTMMFFRGEVREKVGRTQAGEVVVDEADGLAEALQQPAPKAAFAQPMGEEFIAMQIAQAQAEMQAALNDDTPFKCTACETEISDDDYLSPTLARCPAADCCKLIYVEAALAQAAPQY